MIDLQNPKLMDSKKIAASLGVSPFTVDLWRKREGLPFVKVGGRYFFLLERVDEWLREHEFEFGDEEEEAITGVIREIKP